MTEIAIMYYHGEWRNPERIEFADFRLEFSAIHEAELPRWRQMIDEGRQQGFSVGWCHIQELPAADAEWAYREAIGDKCHGCGKIRKLEPCPYDMEIGDASEENASRCCSDCSYECAMDI